MGLMAIATNMDPDQPACLFRINSVLMNISSYLKGPLLRESEVAFFCLSQFIDLCKTLNNEDWQVKIYRRSLKLKEMYVYYVEISVNRQNNPSGPYNFLHNS